LKRVLLVVLIVALSLLLTAGALPASSALPQKLVATWVAKNGTRLTIRRPGSAVFVARGFERLTLAVSATGSRITFGRTILCVRSGVYSWAVAGRSLTLKPVADGCPVRRLQLTGTWTRR
jgi:hypothetical protein